MGRNIEKTADAGFHRLVLQFHVSFLRSPAGLAAVTGHAGADYIFPGVCAMPVAGHNVVESEVAGFFAAVLAGVVVTLENFKAG